jgi:hypothetical protein
VPGLDGFTQKNPVKLPAREVADRTRWVQPAAQGVATVIGSPGALLSETEPLWESPE